MNELLLPLEAGSKSANPLAAMGLSSVEAGRLPAQLGPNATPDPAVHPIHLVVSTAPAPRLEAAMLVQLYLGEYVEAG